MAASDRYGRALAVASVIAVVGACAQVTGLSDDYRFDLPADGADAASTEDGGTEAGRDGSTGDSGGGERCTKNQQAQTQTTFAQSGGDNVPLQCKSCLGQGCCDDIKKCADNAQCVDSMKCVFGCQQKNGNAKTQCLSSCKNAFRDFVGACVASTCGAPTCQLQ